MCRRIAVVLVLLFIGRAAADDKKPTPKPDGPPVAADPRLVVELFAAAPDIVQPIATDFDAKGRLLVVESHTHFRPAKYDGPKFDRVRVLGDTDGDGKADKFTTFFEGTTHTMDLAVRFDGSVYVATRNEVLRLRDTDGDGRADEKTRIVFLETAGNYPHNGLSGLMFDSRGDLFFGIGENLGATYKLVAADGSFVAGGGEGGNVFHCTADGKKLRRYATGFWNPFGACRDIFNRMWVVDNDPDASPPCRLLYLVEGGDYGYQFRYGRSGRHPFQAWNGELPGTLPMAAGTGESPCEVISYESDGLPPEYRGHLLVPVWADHRVERYVPRVQGAGMAADRKPFIQGGKEFRPSGLTVAPDGSLFVTDWVSRSYELHGKGAVWHVRWKDAKPTPRPADPNQALLHADRATRDGAARTLAKDAAGLEYLRSKLGDADVRVRVAALTAVIDAGDKQTDLMSVATKDAEPAVRAMAVRELVTGGADVSGFLEPAEAAAVRVEAIRGAKREDLGLSTALAHPEPYLRHATVQRLASLPGVLGKIDRAGKDRLFWTGILLANRAADPRDGSEIIPTCLEHADPEVRFLAIKWVADEKLTQYRLNIASALAEAVDSRMFVALNTALARIDNKPFNEDAMAVYFIDRLANPALLLAERRIALRAVPATHKKLTTTLLLDLLRADDPTTRVEILRALSERADPAAAAAVRKLATGANQLPAVQAQAMLTLATIAPQDVEFLFDMVGGHAAVRDETLRAMVGAKFNRDQLARLDTIAKAQPDSADLIGRLIGKDLKAGRPAETETDAWLKRLEGPADADAGRRVFENPRVASCAKCHKVDGRGSNVGPDLSLIGRTERKWIVESLLQPASVVAPHYQPWQVTTLDGRSRIGLLVHTNLDESFYVDEKGNRFKVEAKDVDEAVPAKGSVMPNGLADTLTDQELRDLLAYLQGRK